MKTVYPLQTKFAGGIKISVFQVKGLKILGRVGTHILFNIFSGKEIIILCILKGGKNIILCILSRFRPSSGIFLLNVLWRCFFCGSFVVFLSCFCCAFVLVCLFCWCLVVTCWGGGGGGLTSWFSFVMSGCEVVAFPLVSWVRCGA